MSWDANTFPMHIRLPNLKSGFKVFFFKAFFRCFPYFNNLWWRLHCFLSNPQIFRSLQVPYMVPSSLDSTLLSWVSTESLKSLKGLNLVSSICGSHWEFGSVFLPLSPAASNWLGCISSSKVKTCSQLARLFNFSWMSFSLNDPRESISFKSWHACPINFSFSYGCI